MKCPFCAEAVEGEAIVCRTCRRDISIPKPLMEANRALESKVAALEQEVADLRVRLARQTATVTEMVVRFVCDACIYILPAIGVFIVARYVLLLVFNFDLLVLRVVTTITSVGAGFLFQARERPHWFTTLCFSIVIAIGSVLGMALGDQVTMGDSILPSGRFEWVQNAEFVGNIALAFLVGAFVAVGIAPVRLGRDYRAAGFVAFVAAFLAHNLPSRDGQHVEDRIRHFEKIIAFSVSALAFTGSIYSGFSHWLGGPHH